MRKLLALLLVWAVLVLALGIEKTHAQANDEVQGFAETRALTSCVQSENDQLQRLRQLMEQAAERAGRRGLAEDVRRDARASVEALVERIRSQADRVRLCIERAHLPESAEVPERRVIEAPRHALAEEPPRHALAEERGTVHQIESGTAIGPHVRVVRGERVDGSGQAPDRSVENAVRGVGARLSACHDQYTDRLVRREGDVHLSFTAGEGGRVTSSEVEQAGPFDDVMAQCIERAALTMNIVGQHGRSVYSYVLRFELD
jgi:hypothetical protein